jgi:DNA-binding transcriptional LysR family regulator
MLARSLHRLLQITEPLLTSFTAKLKMPNTLPAPRAYLYLDAVARAGSIRKAAERLFVASTALNRKIKEIEDALGTPLFERLPRGVRLTAAGEVMIAMVRRNIADLRATTSHIEHLKGNMRGTVRLGCAESVATDLVPASIADYQTQYPAVKFSVTMGVTASLTNALLQDDLDLMIVHDPVPSDMIKVMISVRQPLCAMVRPDHPLAELTSVKLADCQKYPIALGDATFGSRKLIDAIVNRSRISLNVVLEATSVQVLKEFTLASNAVSFQFEIGIRKEVASGTLVSIPLTDRALSHTKLSIACRSGRTLPIASNSFSQLLETRLTAHNL